MQEERADSRLSSNPFSIPRGVIIITPFLIASIATIITQYVMCVPVKDGSTMLWLGVIGTALGFPLAIIFRSNKLRGIGLGIAVIIGFLIIPYFAFAFGQIHIFMKDDALPDHMEVLECRPTLDRIVWIEKTQGETIVLQGPITLLLHPGEQRVHLGTMTIPSGLYVNGTVYISGVEVDIKEDLSLAGVPPERYEEEYQLRQQWIGEETTNWR